MSPAAAIAAATILAALAVFQAALVAGAQIGRFAWGGAHDVLPMRLRVGSAVSIFLYALMAIVLLDRAGMTAILPGADTARIGAWILVGYGVVGTTINLASRSRAERGVMTPVAFSLAVLSLVVAAGW